MVNARPISLTVSAESWPIAGSFTISRGAKTQAEVVVVELFDGVARGRGECVPYARYGESVASVIAAIDAQRGALAAGLDRPGLQDAMPPGAARNALDCAFWDIEAKRAKTSVAAMIGVAPPRPLTTAFTISLGHPEAMAKAAMDAAQRPFLKIKLGGDDRDGGDPARIAAIRRAVPTAVLIVDANEGWTAKTLEQNLVACAAAKVSLIEQPLPAADDTALAAIAHPVPICADESAHDRASLAGLTARYDAVNIKLDKTGGLTEAIAMADDARARGLDIMAGCMVGTSLAMAPAVLLAQRARYVDLDGPLLLARDRAPGLRYDGSTVYPPGAELWG
ncbi:MAG: L-alanine-DL-glutamate epimerase [Pseudolabrys sp.]|jgi:L-alanine-DL-glutamate epimerase-like enolase superfamily enzyme|nr:L-alanine-DL-glutamate epimerase [Pseudolabrys sp.]